MAESRNTVIMVVCMSVAIVMLSLQLVLSHACPAGRLNSGEKYNALDFMMVNRPHVTYFVDTRYMLCFATLKPTYRDLVPFECSDLLLKYVDDTMHVKLLERKRKEKRAKKKREKESKDAKEKEVVNSAL